MATLTLDTAQGSLLDAVEGRPARGAHAGRRADGPRGGEAAERRAEQPGGGTEAHPAAAAASSPRSARTLDDLIAGAWSAISVTQTAACPLCGDDLVPRFGAGPQPVAGACRSCGTELS